MSLYCPGCKKYFPERRLIDGLCAECYGKQQTQILITALGEDFLDDMGEPVEDGPTDSILDDLKNFEVKGEG